MNVTIMTMTFKVKGQCGGAKDLNILPHGIDFNLMNQDNQTEY